MIKDRNDNFYIGNVKIPGRLVLGPMAGVTDMPYRCICHELGAALVYSEMVSIKGIYYNNKNSTDLLRIDSTEHPVALQLFGNEPELMGEMAKKIEDLPFDILDINMGCPVPKVVNNGEGSALMKNPKLVGEIVSSVVKSIKKPVTIKIRKGFEAADNNAVEIAHIAEECGASAIAVHGRTRSQYYSGKADWEVIKAVKERINIPVIGNGDVIDGQSAADMFEYTGCDAVMVARAARGNPWIFNRINDYLNGIDSQKPDINQIYDMLIRHTEAMIAFKGEYTAIREMRKHTAWYTTGMKDSAILRNKVNLVSDYKQYKELLDNMLF